MINPYTHTLACIGLGLLLGFPLYRRRWFVQLIHDAVYIILSWMDDGIDWAMGILTNKEG